MTREVREFVEATFDATLGKVVERNPLVFQICAITYGVCDGRCGSVNYRGNGTTVGGWKKS